MGISILTITIAIIVAIITFGQWQNSRMQLRYDLFEKRYEVFEKITGFLANVARTGKVEKGAEVKFLQQTKRAYFLFSGDSEINTLILKIYRGSVELWALQEELDSLTGEARSENIHKQRVIKDRFQTELESIEEQFKKYLILKE